MNESKLRRFRDQSSGAATLINDGCKISGEITGRGDFVISGEVAGDCDINGTVTLSADMKTTGNADPLAFVEKRGP